MENSCRFSLGVLSGLLFSAGFGNAANRFDPLPHQIAQGSAHSPNSMAPDCIGPGDMPDPADGGPAIPAMLSLAPADTHSTDWPGVSAIAIEGPFGGVTAAWAYGHAAEESFGAACKRAVGELARHEWVLRAANLRRGRSPSGDQPLRAALALFRQRGGPRVLPRAPRRPHARPRPPRGNPLRSRDRRAVIGLRGGVALRVAAAVGCVRARGERCFFL